jgi:hypothetical protein
MHEQVERKIRIVLLHLLTNLEPGWDGLPTTVDEILETLGQQQRLGGSYSAHITEHADDVRACVVLQWLGTEGEHLAEPSRGITGAVVVAGLGRQVVQQNLRCVDSVNMAR